MKAGYGKEVLTVNPDEVRWTPKPGPFDCGGWKDQNGCTHRDISGPYGISYNVNTKWVIVHEAGHFILRKLGYDEEARCWEHWKQLKGC
jgi:hypothetical protein